MASRKIISGMQCVKVLCKHFEFTVRRRKGSHVVLKRKSGEVTVVPIHDELKTGTLKSVLRLAKVSEDDFYSFC